MFSHLANNSFCSVCASRVLPDEAPRFFCYFHGAGLFNLRGAAPERKRLNTFVRTVCLFYSFDTPDSVRYPTEFMRQLTNRMMVEKKKIRGSLTLQQLSNSGSAEPRRCRFYYCMVAALFCLTKFRAKSTTLCFSLVKQCSGATLHRCSFQSGIVVHWTCQFDWRQIEFTHEFRPRISFYCFSHRRVATRRDRKTTSWVRALTHLKHDKWFENPRKGTQVSKWWTRREIVFIQRSLCRSRRLRVWWRWLPFVSLMGNLWLALTDRQLLNSCFFVRNCTLWVMSWRELRGRSLQQRLQLRCYWVWMASSDRLWASVFAYSSELMGWFW